jgi:hypothetical protein
VIILNANFGFEQQATGNEHNLAPFIIIAVKLADAKSVAFNTQSSKPATRRSAPFSTVVQKYS